MPPSLRKICGLSTLAVLLGLALGTLGPASAATRSLEITDFYLYPDSRTERSMSSFAFPDEKRVNAVIQVRTGGYEKSENLSVFLVIFDSEDKVVDKHKTRFNLPAGTHDLVLSDVVLTSELVGEQQLRLKVEVGLKGALPAHDEASITVSGPEPPRIEIRDLLLYNPTLGRQSSTFDPGDTFTLEASIEIGDNPGRLAPTLLLYAAMDEDGFDTDPHESYQPYNNQWDRLKLSNAKDGGVEGLYNLRASGRMPRFFANPYEPHHPVRVFVIIDWGIPEPGKLSDQAVEDYVEGEVFDFYPGDSRSSQELRDRLVEMNRAYTWELRRVRGDLPGEN